MGHKLVGVDWSLIMKKLFAAVVLMFLCHAGLAQSVNFRNLSPSQFGSNAYVVYIKSGTMLTNPIVNGVSLIDSLTFLTNSIGSGFDFSADHNYTGSNNFAGNVTFVLPPLGDGGGFSNVTASFVSTAVSNTFLNASQNATNAGNIGFLPANQTWTGDNIFSGNTTFASLGTDLFFPTNTVWLTNAASDVVVDFGKPLWFISTNNNLSLANCANYDANVFSQTLINITNSSAAAVSVTMHANFQNMRPAEGNTLFCTNFAQLLVFAMQGTGTNFYWMGR